MPPKLTFVNDPKTEANYICFLARNLVLGHYQKGSKLVLPYAAPIESSVYFPNLAYSPKFWRRIAKMSHCDYGKPYPTACVTEVAALLSTPASISSDYRAQLTEFTKLCSQLGLTKTLAKVTTIKLLMTPYGTHGSYYPARNPAHTYTIKITARTDFPPTSIIRTLLLALYAIAKHQSAEIGDIPWYERQAAIDFVLQTKFTKPTPKHIQESAAYLAKLGLTKSYAFTMPTNLSPQEKIVMSALVEHSGQVLDYDHLADLVWRDQFDTKFSLTSLAKIIQNLKTKLQQSGNQPGLIKSARSQGYYFHL